MLTMAAAGIIGSIISGLVAAGSAVANTVSQVKTNEQNAKNVQETNALNEKLTRESWARDDSQLQRARADAEAAGFSPLAALSNNLTNTAPATMQAPQAVAPQFDSSGLISSIQEGTRAYQNGKVADSQKSLIDSQKKAQDIENEINNSTKWAKKLQNVANLAKTMKELDSMNLSNYEKASILVASGIPSSTVERLIKHTTKENVVKNTSQDSLNKLQAAQTNLINEQITTQQKTQNLLDIQKELTNAQKAMTESEHKYWYEDKVSVLVPHLTFKNNDMNQPYMSYETYTGTRKDALEKVNNRLNELSGYDYLLKFSSEFWKKVDSIFGWFK